MLHDNQSSKGLYKVGLGSAILSAISWVIFIVGNTGLPDSEAIDDPLLLFQTIQEARSVYLLYGWGGIFGTLLTLPYVLAFYEATKDVGPMRNLAAVTAIIGIVLAVIGFSKPLTTTYWFVPTALAASPDQLPMLKVAARFAGDAFEVVWWIGSFLVYGLGVGLIAYQAWRTTATPKWINAIGIIGGLSGIIWLRHFLTFLLPLTLVLSLVNILTIIIWSIALAVVLVRHRTSVAPSVA